MGSWHGLEPDERHQPNAPAFCGRALLGTSRATAWREPQDTQSHFASRVGHACPCGEPQRQRHHGRRNGPNQLHPLSRIGAMGHHTRPTSGPLRGHTCGGLAPQTQFAAPRQHLVWRRGLPLHDTRTQFTLPRIGTTRNGAHRIFALMNRTHRFQTNSLCPIETRPHRVF